MLVDVIIPAYNPGVYLDRAIDSVMSQSVNSLNVIVIDDNSQEDVKAIISKYNGVKYIKNNKNMGPSYSRNIGIKASSSKYISFLDADDLWCKDKIKLSIDILNNDDSIGMTCGNYKRLMPGGRLTRPFYSGPVNISFKSLLKQNLVASGSVTARRSVVEKSGLFDERFRVCEDYALWLSISKFSKIHYIHDILYLYRVVPGGLSITQSVGIQKIMDYNCKIIRDEIING